MRMLAVLGVALVLGAAGYADRTRHAGLGEVAAGNLPLSHEALDTHPRRRGADYLRHLLVANGVLPARDDALVRLEAWVAVAARAAR